LGFGIAVFVAFLPLVGIQTFIALGLAAVFRANKAVCVPIVWITNPATLVPIYYGCFKLGQAVMPVSSSHGEEDVAKLSEFAAEASIFELEFWSGLLKVVLGLGVELWVGCIIVGTVLGLCSYFLVRWVVTAYREKRRQRQLRRQLFRAQLKLKKANATP
jgi:uncharacterized protein (DUF2062 family)